MALSLPTDFRSEPFSLLIADDQKFMLKNLERYFKNYFVVLTASSFIEAKGHLISSPIGIVLSDHQMESGQGLEILEFVRDNHPATRRVLITGDRNEDIVIEMMTSRLAHSFAYKPTVKDQIHVILEEQAKLFLENR